MCDIYHFLSFMKNLNEIIEEKNQLVVCNVVRILQLYYQIQSTSYTPKRNAPLPDLNTI